MCFLREPRLVLTGNLGTELVLGAGWVGKETETLRQLASHLEQSGLWREQN